MTVPPTSLLQALQRAVPERTPIVHDEGGGVFVVYLGPEITLRVTLDGKYPPAVSILRWDGYDSIVALKSLAALLTVAGWKVEEPDAPPWWGD